ncbi:hypothetical protein GMPD_18920 [Geomonas paludis]|uniref:Uncharacterized protein n=1 Tax=Geomonas paludis TaxID=2740185 RepID=A0A6V8MWM4_9BACT|nr:hypothetical protein GMPD_18920 [Geomonas paludis]
MQSHPYFMPLLLVAVLTFCYSCYQRLQLVTAGAAEDRSTARASAWPGSSPTPSGRGAFCLARSA